MQPPPHDHTPQGGGAVGFGCGFILIGVIAFSLLPVMRHGFLMVLVIALAGGWIAATVGDPFFNWIFRWWRWW